MVPGTSRVYYSASVSAWPLGRGAELPIISDLDRFDADPDLAFDVDADREPYPAFF